MSKHYSSQYQGNMQDALSCTKHVAANQAWNSVLAPRPSNTGAFLVPATKLGIKTPPPFPF